MIPFRTYDPYQPSGPFKVPPKTLRRRTLTGPFRGFGHQLAMSVCPQGDAFSYVALVDDYMAMKTEAHRSFVKLTDIFIDRALRDGSPYGEPAYGAPENPDSERSSFRSSPSYKQYEHSVTTIERKRLHRSMAARKRDLG